MPRSTFIEVHIFVSVELNGTISAIQRRILVPRLSLFCRQMLDSLRTGCEPYVPNISGAEQHEELLVLPA